MDGFGLLAECIGSAPDEPLSTAVEHRQEGREGASEVPEGLALAAARGLGAEAMDHKPSDPVPHGGKVRSVGGAA
jgi:hypothetical protein